MDWRGDEVVECVAAGASWVGRETAACARGAGVTLGAEDAEGIKA